MKLKKIFSLSIIFTFLTIVGLQIIGGHLITTSSPMGIVSFEFSTDLQNAQQIVNSWGEKGKIYAGLDLGLDYLFIFLYTTTLISACYLIISKISSSNNIIYSLSRLMIAGTVIAALLDCLENFALIMLLTGQGTNNLAALAAYCAAPKFILVGIVIVFIIATTIFLKLSSAKNDTPLSPVD